jgi:hypothetical protein
MRNEPMSLVLLILRCITIAYMTKTKMLDNASRVGTIIFTHKTHAETPNSPPDGHAQSAARPGDGRIVHRQRFLRSERPPAGEIRNAASRSLRRLHREASSATLWLFAPVLLSGSGDFHARWPGRAGTPEAGTETRSQAVPKDHGIYRADHRRRSRSGLGRRCTAGVRHLRASTEHRAGVGPSEKKTTLAMAGHDGPVDRTDGPAQARRYEDLRGHVIGHGGGHRLGLALFHREGMKAWLDAWSTCTTRDARPLRDTSGDPDWVRPVTLAGDVGAIVHLVASMAMATLQDVSIVNSGPQPRELSS